jgi:pimeloyl-ACP methyl ester carboxylesterase
MSVPADSPKQSEEAAEIVPFVLNTPIAEIQDLRERLRHARLPEPETVTDWSQGVPRVVLAEMCQAWIDHDWRALETELNALGQWRTHIDGLGVHFLHVRSRRADARPLLITHGWPGSVAEFIDVLPELVEPPSQQPAFHVVLPSLPGFGFSEKPAAPGWGLARVADAWAELMQRLGYERFLAQGGDWGAMITTTLTIRHPHRVSMMHTTVPWASRPRDFQDTDLTATEVRWLAEHESFRRTGSGYAALQSTRPQTFGYGLTDSPAGQLAWILEAYFLADRNEDGEPLVPRRRMLDGAAVYWFSRTAASSARLYWEALGTMDMTTPVAVPAAVSVFPKELMKLPRAWVEARYKDLRYWNVLGSGGHFPMLETPQVFVSELRAAFADAPS